MTTAVRAAGLLVLSAVAVAWGQPPVDKKDAKATEKSDAKPADTKDAKPATAEWAVLFRSDDPAHWDKDAKNAKGEQVAIPVKFAPENTRFLRLRRMDTWDVQIIPVTRDRLANGKPGDGAADFWWSGTAKEDWKGRHLGIAQTPRYKFPHSNKLIHVMTEGWDGYTGSGFGHKVDANDKQYYCWKGKEIPKTEFEVAVSAGPLSADEEKNLASKP